MRTNGTLLDRLIMLAVLVLFVGVLMVLVLTHNSDPATLALFSSPAVVALVGVVISARQGSIAADVRTTVHQTNGLLSGPLVAIQATAEANGAKLDALPGATSGAPGSSSNN
jgi:hypothetical protein